MRKLILCLLLLAPMAWAQQATLPAYNSVYVNDYADLLSEAAEAELTGYLKDLKSETGVEMTVLTIKERDSFGLHGSFESFARDIFNSWGIGDSTKNNGILFLVASEDREMRIELGSGYTKSMNRTAEEIIDRTILPHFADQDFERGILRGSEEIERKIARGQNSGGGLATPNNIVFSLFAAVVAALMGKKFLDNRRQRRCPACKSEDIAPADDTAAGRGRVCRNCGHRYFLPFPTHRPHDSNDRDGGFRGGGGFGGGSSSGGGASGRW